MRRSISGNEDDKQSNYDEIEVATIALPLQSSLAMLVMQCQTRNLPKSVLHAQSFFLIFSFSFSHRCCGCTRLANSITTQNNPWYAMILSEKPTSWWKNAPWKCSGYQYRGSILLKTVHREKRYGAKCQPY